MKKPVTLEHVVIAGVVVVGFLVLAGPISDNSALLHIRAGMGIVDLGSVPSLDPYSFTAEGERWVVQSWLAELLYGWAESIDPRFIILIHMVLGGVLAFVIAMLAKTGSMIRTLAATVVSMVLLVPYMVPRPYMFGLACFALMTLVVMKRRSPWLLLPIAWVWVNTHGSFPLGFVWFAAYAIGRVLDHRGTDTTSRRRTDTSGLRYLLTFAGGVVVGGLANPVGIDLLTFSARASGDRAEVFARIVEWGSPNFHGASGIAVAAALTAVLLMIRRGATWSEALPFFAFLPLALYAERNIPVLAIVAATAIGASLRRDVPRQAPQESQLITRAALAIVVLAGFGGLARLSSEPAYALESYPVAAMDWLDENGLTGPGHRLLSTDVIGCYRIFRDGRDADVFIDDRLDMYPPSVSLDYINIHDVDSTTNEILNRYKFDLALWDRGSAFDTYLANANDWDLVWSDENYSVYQRAMQIS